MNTSPAAPNRKRLASLVVLGCVALAAAASLTAGLVAWPARKPAETTRALSAEEAGRLAAMRVTNHRDGRAGLRATLGPAEAPTRLAGWVDWGRALVYLAVRGTGDGVQPGLLQAVPGIVASRPEPAGRAAVAASPGATDGDAAVRLPPGQPPADGWRIRRLAADGPRASGVDALLNLLFALSAERPDAVGQPGGDPARWLGRTQLAGTSVDVLLGAAGPASTTTGPASATTGPAGTSSTGSGPTPPTAPTTTAPAAAGAPGGAVRYWLDGDARLHRLEAVLAGDVRVQLDLDRTARPELAAIDALGGHPVRPRAVTGDEAELLAAMPRKNRSRGGAKITLAVPTVRPGDKPAAPTPEANLRGAGWVDWRSGIAYLGVHDLDGPAGGTLLRADRKGVAFRDAPREPARSTGAGQPPLPPPADRDWSYDDWQRRTDGLGGLDLDLLINEALATGSTADRDETNPLRERAGWLRQDTLGDQRVTVFEIARPAEAGTPRGQARLRYWVDGSGLLRRLELRTRTGAFGQLDLVPGPAPYVASVPIS